MKSFKTGILIFIITIAVSCKSNNTSSDPDNLSAELIKVTVEATLKLDPGTSTEDYLIDFGKIKEINAGGIAIYLKIIYMPKEQTLTLY